MFYIKQTLNFVISIKKYMLYCIERQKMNKKYNITRKILIFWTLFIGIGAVAGAVGMLVDPSGKAMGMDAMLPYFQVLPFADVLFQNFIFSGVMLLIINGTTNLVAGSLLFARKKAGIILGITFGITLMLWIVIQFVVFPFNFMSTAFFIFGFLQFLTGYICFVRFSQSQFAFDENDYTNIGKDKTKIVIFFSRLGSTKKLAHEIADEQGAEILEIKTTEKIDGDLGFWWCGRFGMHKWGMPLSPTNFDPSKYDEITICTPVWVFATSAPIRQFCKMYCGKISNPNYVTTHFMNCKFRRITKELDNLLQTTHKSFRTFRNRFGKTKELK